jgi:hypothetical protein
MAFTVDASLRYADGLYILQARTNFASQRDGIAGCGHQSRPAKNNMTRHIRRFAERLTD